jgi:hypothetical protein
MNLFVVIAWRVMESHVMLWSTSHSLLFAANLNGL